MCYFLYHLPSWERKAEKVKESEEMDTGNSDFRNGNIYPGDI